MNLTTAFLWTIFPLLGLAMARLLYVWGRMNGAARERIKLYGNTLPRLENPPPPPKPKVPTMPNHPPLPDEEALLKAKERMAARPNPRSLQGNYQPKGVIEEQARALAEDYIKENPEATSLEAWSHAYSMALNMFLAADRVAKANEDLQQGPVKRFTVSDMIDFAVYCSPMAYNTRTKLWFKTADDPKPPKDSFDVLYDWMQDKRQKDETAPDSVHRY